jgi:hypothetical protein
LTCTCEGLQSLHCGYYPAVAEPSPILTFTTEAVEIRDFLSARNGECQINCLDPIGIVISGASVTEIRTPHLVSVAFEVAMRCILIQLRLPFSSGLYAIDQALGCEDVHHSFQVVGEHVQAHFRLDLR